MELEQEINAWLFARRPNTMVVDVAAKLAEEAGEVCGAVLKSTDGHISEGAVLDELGDVLIVCSVLAGCYGVTLDDVRAARWAEVAAR